MSFVIAVRGLWSNKMRSILTLLGMIIGIAAVITIVSLADGLKRQITNQVESLGSNLVWFFPSPSVNMRREQGSHGGGPMGQMGVDEITLEEIEKVARESPVKVKFSPIAMSTMPVKFENISVSSEIYGVYGEYFEINNLDIASGDRFSTADVKGLTRVCVIGSETATDLFKTRDPIGQQIKIGGGKYTIVGVLTTKGGGFGDNPDQRIYLPYFTAQKQIFKALNPFFSVFQVTEFNKMDDFKYESRMLMNQIRGVTDPNDEQYMFQSQTDALKELGGIIKGMVYVFGGIAAVSLLVGGIGIMNIMLVTVTERTREIGLRKAVGARKSDILMQFLIEAMVLCVIGGLFGMVFGYLGAMGISKIIANASPDLSWEASLSPMVVLLAVGIASLVGMIFGVYPASNAAKLNPIDALRYE